jgi:hypothetical protein
LRDRAGPDDGVFVSTAFKSSVVAYYSGRPAYGFVAARRRDPVYRDPGDVETLFRTGGIRWVVLDRDSQSRATTAADDPAPYSRLVRVLQGHGHELAYVVQGPTPDRWLAQVYRMTDSSGGQQPVPPVAVAGRGDGRLVALTYGACLALAAGIVVLARRRVQS